MNHLKPVYGLILRGWVATYEDLYRDNGPQGNFEMDYPPMRLLVYDSLHLARPDQLSGDHGLSANATARSRPR